ncbi:MAG: hypothetical protein J6R44_04445, partial [Clostridia bacterium]|nr:hypothetical protein [Clostridia bacterium]
RKRRSPATFWLKADGCTATFVRAGDYVCDDEEKEIPNLLVPSSFNCFKFSGKEDAEVTIGRNTKALQTFTYRRDKRNHGAISVRYSIDINLKLHVEVYDGATRIYTYDYSLPNDN